ncbi:MAG: hypothetical protein HYY44_03945 [Deltaproteobacteria bacterium]|nr:hypothetical protein [Deltaproteobacteria bacterium]MBI4373782.1 hypothetical protein [Deltaproteobacteria bacterium]
MSPAVWQFIILGVIGIAGEVFFTAIKDFAKTRHPRLHGFSFVWMFPLYGLLSILFPIVSPWVADFSWPVRGSVYMMVIYLVEFIAGSILTAIIGSHVWNYSHHRFNLRGQISLWYAPVWFFVGLIVERCYPWLIKASLALAHL